MRLSLTMKVSLLLGAAACVVVISLVKLYSSSIELAKNVPVVKLAERQRMLSLALYRASELINNGQEEGRTELRKLIIEFRESLATLEEGGTTIGVNLPPASLDIVDEISEVGRVWSMLEPAFLTLIKDPNQSQKSEQAFDFIASMINQLTEASDVMVIAIQEEAIRWHERIRALIITATFASFALLIGAGFIAKRYVNNLEQAEQELSKSNESLSNEIVERKLKEADFRQSEKRFQALLQSRSDALVIVDEKGLITLVNDRVQALFGYVPEELIDQPVEILLSNPFRAEHGERRNSYDSKARTRFMGEGVDLNGVRKDGSEFPVEISLSQMPIDGGMIVCTVIRDVTERNETERKLISYTAELERSNGELQNFASLASHDLQEPLRKVKAFSDRLKKQLGDSIPVAGLDSLERMLSSVDRMQTLINDLLNYSRVTIRSQPFAKVKLSQIVTDVLDDLETLIKKSEVLIEVNIDNLPVIDADAVQMRRLFQNLISNAVKFRQPGQLPVIKISSEYLESDALSLPSGNKKLCRILVKDNGIGFDEKYLSNIFDLFKRLHGSSEYEGTGMGLAICRKIVSCHGGHITAKSKLGEGATFIVTLPVEYIESEKPYESALQTEKNPFGR